jgi:hypothetical protein
MLLLKFDIVKAFDNVRWEYLLELMEQLGFGQRWRDIMPLIWSTTTSRIILNGEPQAGPSGTAVACSKEILSQQCYSSL